MKAKFPNMDRLHVTQTSDDQWSIEFEGSDFALSKTTAEAKEFFNSVSCLLAPIDDREGNDEPLTDYIMALNLVFNEIDARIRIATKRIREGEK